MPTPIPTDELACRMMTEILASREFQRHWTEQLAEAMNVQNKLDSLNNTPIPDAENANFRGQNVEEMEVENALEQLIRSLQLSVETFLRSVQLADRIERFNCESSTLYSIRVQLDRLVGSERFVHAKFLFVSRRLGYLIKTFIIRLSSAFDVRIMNFFACNLCDMLYRLEEFLSIHRSTTKGSFLQRATDDFYNNVIKTLNKMQTKNELEVNWRSTQSLRAARSSTLSHAQTQCTTPTHASPSVFYRKSFSDDKPKSFLLPADLAEARHRIRQNASIMKKSLGSQQSLTSKTPQRPSSVRITVQPPLSRAEIEKRWSRLMENDRLLQQSMENTPEDRSAFKMACEITREVVDELEKRIQTR
ncbi:hypothetical protein M3Y96_00020200 [Aphelenchoides besseyi]|nr:hypothetical protein M3Y96_00020200 [Aphelenchoides besseyi]